jgi:hypothetical protein
VQTKSVNGVYSALAPVATKLRFCPDSAAPPLPGDTAHRVEERQVAAIEWFAFPFHLGLLPPRDTTGSTGFAMVPMPKHPTRLQDAATANGNGTAMTLTDSTVVLEITAPVRMSGGTTINFEASNDGSTYAPIQGTNVDTGANGTTTTTPGDWRFDVTNLKSIRARISAYSAGTITVVGLVQLDDQLANLEYVRHPDGKRCLHFRWNRGPTAPPPGLPASAIAPPDLIAAYELYEFDADAHIPATLNQPGGDSKSFPTWANDARLRKVQEVDILSPEDVLTTPADTADFLRWEAWYPSDRRLQDLAASLPDLVKHSQAATPPWYSWAESLLEWPPLVWKPGGGAPNQPFLVQTPGADGKTLVWVRAFDANGRPQTIHPALKAILDQIAAFATTDPNRPYRVVRGPRPARMPANLGAVMSDTGAKVDPYGWGLLQLVGLSVSFCVRSSSLGDTGEPLAPDELMQFVRKAIDSLAGPLRDFASFLHVEYLFQPAKSTRASADEPLGPSDDPSIATTDLLAIVQLSLRPAFLPWAAYFQAELDQQPSPSDPLRKPPFTAGKLNVTIKGDKNGPTVTLVIQSDTDIVRRQLSADTAGAGKLTTIPFTLPATGKTNLYFRVPTSLTQAVTVTVDWTPTATESIPQMSLTLDASDPTTIVSTYFLAEIDAVSAAVTNAGASDGTWNYLGAYIAGAVNGADATKAQANVLPLTPNDASGPGADLLAWLDRFFLHGGADNAGKIKTGPGPWVGTAYLRAVSPIAVTPDQRTGVLDYYHPIEDPYAHAYRYYFRPIGRYDRLWESVAQAPSLVPAGAGASDAIAQRLDGLRKFETPQPGGLDLVLYRTRPIAAPTVLHTGRLDALATSSGNGTPKVQPAPPGRYWQLVVAKHPEQTLSEHNQTLAQRLGYRQIAWSLVRVFNPDDVSKQQALLPILTSRISKAFATPDSTPVATTAHKMFLLLDGPTPVTQTIDLVDAAHDNLNGLADKIKELALDGVSAKVVTPAPGQSFLRVWSPPGTTVRLGTDATPKTSDILSDANSILPTKSVKSPALPGPPPVPVPFDSTTLATDTNESLEVDLAARLGRFGEGAIALSWKALPFYYEHKVMLIAQSTNTTSDIVSVSQRAFEYVSPIPRALVDGVASLRQTRVRRVRFRLEDYWSCLPSQADGDTPAQESWPIEDPNRIVFTFSGAHPPTPTGSDPLAGRAEIDDSDVPMTLTWHGYLLTTAQAAGLKSWRTNNTFSAEFRASVGALVTQLNLRQWRTLSSLPDPAVVYQFILSKPGAVVQALSEFYFGPDPTTKALGYQPRNFGTKIDGIEWLSTAPIPLPEDTDLNQPRDVYLQSQLGPKGVVPDNWISTRAITAGNAFTLPKDVTPELKARVAFPAPDVLTLATFSNVAFTASEIQSIQDALLKTPNKPGDAAFRDAVTRFCTRLAKETTIVEPVAVGLEALAELSPTVTLPTANPGKLTWLGPITADNAKVIQRWIDHLSPFAKTLQALLAADAAFTISESYTAPGAHPKPADVPAVLSPNLTIVLPTTAGGAEALVWKGRTATAAQDASLQTWQNDTTIDQNFRDAVKALRDALAHPEAQSITIDVTEPGWQPRPLQADIATAIPGLADRVQIGVGLLAFKGLMLREEAETLVAAASTKVDQAAVSALYLDALNGGFEGARLQIRAYRGSAEQESRDMEVLLNA